MPIKNHIFIVCFLFMLCDGYSQALYVSYGPIYTKTNAIVPIVNSSENFTNTDFIFLFAYEHFFKNKFSLIASYCGHGGYTFMNYQLGGYLIDNNTAVTSSGFSSATLAKHDISLAYNIMGGKKRFYLKPTVGLGLQISKKNGVGVYDILTTGPDYIQTAPKILNSQNTGQITVSTGLKLGFVFWKRLDVGLTIQGIYAAKTYQQLYYDYNYKSVPQPTAVFSSTGTGYFYTLGIGYRFAKYIK